MTIKIDDLLHKAHRVVIKVGTSTLTHPNGKLNLFQLERLVKGIAELKNKKREVILVSSGAIGAGMGRLGLAERPKTMPEKQALAAIGQGILMHMYENLFSLEGETVAQILLTKDDVAHRERYLNARNTLSTLLKMGAIPIINENDTVVVEEIKIGENDTLSALVAGLIDADLLILLSDIDGLYTDDPRKNPDAKLIPIVEQITPEIGRLAKDAGSIMGSGGMTTKINAARISINYGIPMIVANGSTENVLRDVSTGKNPGTIFLPLKHKIRTRKGWIAYGSKTHGTLWLDEGAARALAEKGKSLLPSGIVRVEGNFQRGHVVSIIGEEKMIARGIVNYSAEELQKIKGRQCKEIADILGYKDEDEAIHRDNLSLVL